MATDPSPPLHDLDPTGRFSDRVRDYARFRPSYPPGAIDAVLEGLGDPHRLAAVDAGAGTGISARLVADRGVHVVAVEPNRAMREAAVLHPRVRFVEATAEATGLPQASQDLVLSAQAFHWFRAAEALAELRRILKPNGRLAILWNRRDESDAFTAAYSVLVRVAAAGSPAEGREETFEPAVKAGGFERARVVTFRNEQVLDLAGLLGRAESASYVPKEGLAHDALMDRLRGLFPVFADGAGRLRMAYRTHVLLAESPAIPRR